ncbi:Major capsid protein [Chelonid alphaherpesvirus 5]|uniref:Major capsid protein n=1 Tax=Chelonid alphaherpesvirus 5 TaxID=702736 RepID=V5NXE0_9ALPH|nr:Major capsid protein [Chelonid alphaherpesvirus 5]AHA93344.1 Major capsid protein [Chelonid alphaherpesvirus 5]
MAINAYTGLTDQIFPRESASQLRTGNVLSFIRVTSHEAFYDGLKTIISDDPDLYRTQFDMLLGSYCNALTLVKFLETGLSVACICVKYPELDYTNKATVQFKIILPSIARSNLENAEKPTYLYMTKQIERDNLRAVFSISSLALRHLLRETEDGTALERYHTELAIGQLTQNVQVTLDSFERGTVHQLLRIFQEKAPPSAVLKTLNVYLTQNTPLEKVPRANLISTMKRNIILDTFFVNKAVGSATLPIRLLEMVSATRKSVNVPVVTHSALDGTPVDGVLLTTKFVRDYLLTFREYVYGEEALVPGVYANMMIDGNNMVTAVAMGKAVNTFEQLARNVLNYKGAQQRINEELVSDAFETQQTIRVPAKLLKVGEKLVFLEALEYVYTDTKNEYPLVSRLDLTFMMPLGVFKPAFDRYAAKGTQPLTDDADPRKWPPTEIHFYNKDQSLIRLKMEHALGTLCHPLNFNTDQFMDARDEWKEGMPVPRPFAFSPSRVDPTLLLNQRMRRFLERVVARPEDYVLDGEAVNRMSPCQFLRADNRLLTLERHPFFDFFTAYPTPEMPLRDSLAPVGLVNLQRRVRIINGNIPLPLQPVDYRDARGAALEALYGRGGMSPSTVAIIQATYDDRNYPPVLYMIEAAVHGDGGLFASALQLIRQCILSYWQSARGAAFVNSFPMLYHIVASLGNGDLPLELLTVYRELLSHVENLRRLITDFTVPGPPLINHTPESLNHLLADPCFLPPIIYDADPLLTPEHRAAAGGRAFKYDSAGVELNIEVGWPALNNVSWSAKDNRLIHSGPAVDVPVRDNEWQIHGKIFYYVVLPAFARGRCCTAGVNYLNLYDQLSHLATDETAAKKTSPTSTPKLTKVNLNTLLHNYNLTEVDATGLEGLREFFSRPVSGTRVLNYESRCDPGLETRSTRHQTLYDAALINGLILMNYPKQDRALFFEDFFYAVPTCALYANRTAVAATHRAANLNRLDAGLPLVPTFCSCELVRHVRLPVARYAETSRATVNRLTYGLMAGYFKMTPVAFIHQLRRGLHPGFAFTVVRQDNFQTEQMLYAERCSEGVFFGTTDISRVDEADYLTMELNQNRAHIDMGLGFTACAATAYLQTPVSDMGNFPQNLFNVKNLGDFYHDQVTAYVRQALCDNDRSAFPASSSERSAFGFNQETLSEPPALERGHPSVCEFVVTPVSTDLKYFYEPNNPRGRSGCVITSKNFGGESTLEGLLYDHSFPDPAHRHRATANPWASQRFSLGDVLYNTSYTHTATHSTFYSPCAKFFTAPDVAARNKGLLKMLADYGKSVVRATTRTDYQFKSPVHSRELTRDPCAFFQEAYPAMCSSDASLFRKYKTSETMSEAHDEQYYAQYLVEDHSPLQGILSLLR